MPYRGVEQLEARRAHNPEVVGSSPASATIKTTVFSLKHGGFSNICTLFKTAQFDVLGQFGVNGSKIEVSCHRLEFSRRSFLCLLPEQHVGDAFGCLRFVFLYDVAVEVLCCVHTGMA